jgi:iron complex outermembrane recepter protein
MKSCITFITLQLLFFWGQTAFAQKTVTGKISDTNGETLPGVTILIKGTSMGTTSDMEGSYNIPVKEGVTLVFSSVGFTSCEIMIGKADTLNVTLKAENINLGELVIVGSRNPTRTKTDTPVAVDIIPMNLLLQSASQVDLNAMLTYFAPSFQSNRQTIADGTDHIDPASLRGLGPDQILVLINGKRRHTTSLVNVNGTFGRGSVGTDMNTIPASAIERIEILRDGAAAQYGSDAIAGVINIVLKKEVEKLTSFLTSGIHKAGDGAMLQYNTNYGFKLGEKGYIIISGDLTKRGYTNRADDYSGPIFSSDGQGDEAELVKRELTRHDFRMHVGNSAITNAATFFNASLPLAPNTELYAFGGLNYRFGESAGFYRLPNQTDRVVTEIYPNGFLPEILSNIVDKSLGIGLKGKVKGWNVDFSNTFGRNFFMFTVSNSLNASLLTASPTNFNPGGFSFTQNTTNLDFNHYFKSFLTGFNLAFGSEFRVDNYGIIAGEENSWKNYGFRNITKTVEVKDDNGSVIFTYEKVVGQFDELKKAGGAQVFPGFRPENAINRYRSNISVYLDTEADITRSFMVSGAARFEHYSDFGSTLNGKLAARLNFSKKYALRGAVSTGFRAPSLHQQFYSSVITRFLGDTPFEVGTFSNESTVAKVLGIPKLKEETSVNMSLGFTARPIESLTLTADLYSIQIKDRIVLTGLFSGNASAPSGSQDRRIYDLLYSVNANLAQFFTNAISTNTNGLDLVATWKMTPGKGNLNLSLAANLNKTTVGDKINTSDLLKGKESVYFSRDQKGVYEVGTPRNKVNLTVNYKSGKFSTMIRTVRFGEITFLHPDDGGSPDKFVLNTFTGKKETRDQTFSAKFVTDFSISHQINPNLSITLGGNNIFDIYPDKQKHSDNNAFGRFVYSRQITQFGFNGAFYFVRLGFIM